MTACARWREELIDHALDRPATAAFAAHLGTCAGCTDAFAGLRARAGQLDASVRALVTREPPSSLRSRVLAGIDAGAVPPAFVWRTRSAIAGAVLSVILVFVTYDAALKSERAQSAAIASGAVALSHWRAPTDVLLPNQ
ncbi:MAG TPA: hypothetical protein VN224_04835 [Xanthomonadales bacterium]|nr:hypothetical protein [Xanthomonadales bacterium]